MRFFATALLFTCRHYRAENRRLVGKPGRPWRPTSPYRTRLGAEAASVQALRLRCGEFETLRAADAEADPASRHPAPQARSRRQAVVAVTDAEIRTAARPSSSGYTTRSRARHRPDVPAGATRGFRSKDASAATSAARIRSVDTRQAVHRIPRRFLFIRWGTKALRREIVSTNPHTDRLSGT